VYSTLLGGSSGDQGSGIAVDGMGNAYVTGFTDSADFTTTPEALQSTLKGSSNAFVTKLNPQGTALVYSAFLGGSGDDRGTGIAVDGAGNAYVAAISGSADFPTTAAAFRRTPSGGRDAAVAKLNAVGAALVYSTFVGSAEDRGRDLALRALGVPLHRSRGGRGNAPYRGGGSTGGAASHGGDE
jgi:hypothetical protein